MLILSLLCITIHLKQCYSLCDQGKMYTVQQITEPVLHAEGPHWGDKEQVLYFVDITGNGVHKFDPTKKTHSKIILDQPVGVAIPIKNNFGKFILGYGTNITLLEWDGISTKNYKLKTKYTVDEDKPGNRFNDGKADKIGNLWIGTMGLEKPVGVVKEGQGSLYRLSTDCKLEKIITPVSISNGIIWNHDYSIMYYIDSPTRKIQAFDYNAKNANIQNGRILFDFEEHNVSGVPDGMTIDNEDNLWIACWGGNKVIQVSKEGKLLCEINLPVSRITSVTWGGKNLDTLFVTTMKFGLTENELMKQPGAGAVFAVNGLGFKGHTSNNNIAEDILKCFNNLE